MILNPQDNAEHLPEDYISDILDAAGKGAGAVYDHFDEGMIISPDTLTGSRRNRISA
jgi:hypothetical protein